MIRHRKARGGYWVVATGDKKLREAFFAHTRSDEEAHIRFVEANRDLTNHKPRRSPALRAKARELAYVGRDGAWHSPVGRF